MTERERERKKERDRGERGERVCGQNESERAHISKQQSVWDKAMRLVVYPRGAIKVEPAKRLMEGFGH